METEISRINPLYYQDASGLANLIRTRQVSAVEVMKTHLDRIGALNPSINAVVTIAANVENTVLLTTPFRGKLTTSRNSRTPQ